MPVSGDDYFVLSSLSPSSNIISPDISFITLGLLLIFFGSVVHSLMLIPHLFQVLCSIIIWISLKTIMVSDQLSVIVSYFDAFSRWINNFYHPLPEVFILLLIMTCAFCFLVILYNNHQVYINLPMLRISGFV